MSTLKNKVYKICSDVASEYPGWEFLSSGQFKNKSLKHLTLAINLGFGFTVNDTPLLPAIHIYHKKSMALFKKLNGYDRPTSIVRFQTVYQLLTHMPEDLRRICWILADKNLQMKVAPPSEGAKKQMIDVTECRPILQAVMADGIALIEKLYHLDSEESFLRNLPPKYTPGSDKVPYDEFERNKGVMVCIARALTGDFDFTSKYRDDNYSTVFPKNLKEIDSLLEIMPELKIQFYKKNNVV
ncbi:hypothetical protein [Undibacterium pigrum]|uniref:Uncharacterized protein n=1 Tax=Undibacterium pigrum TaxID=401470 RepID=A0A318IJL2_9BURK|nr:hypothetical protein [Undibacterium pigrum]PXX33728.1 hypothetical protein DFR42_1283 [Undibacterium pigrum]